MAYKLVPSNSQTLLAKPDTPVSSRASFASKNLWVTQYNPEQRWPGAPQARACSTCPTGARRQSLELLPPYTGPALQSQARELLAARCVEQQLRARQAGAPERLRHCHTGGDYPLQNLNPGGLAEWTKDGEEVTQPVLWHIFGTTHIVRPEDFPVRPAGRPCWLPALPALRWLSGGT